SASSLNIAQIMGRNNNSQSVDAGFNQTRFNVLIKGTWQPTPCETEDFERTLDGTEVPVN
ncbi:MAG: hypothetical protein VX527_02845, partial [Planctomycetota bacterium]|nr:hypothetical protein [Planctomycetota bacterium]